MISTRRLWLTWGPCYTRGQSLVIRIHSHVMISDAVFVFGSKGDQMASQHTRQINEDASTSYCCGIKLPQPQRLKTTQILLSSLSGDHKCEMALTRLKPRCLQAASLLKGLGEYLSPRLFKFLKASCTPWLVTPSFTFKVRSVASSSLSFWRYCLPLSLTRAPVITLGPPDSLG